MTHLSQDRATPAAANQVVTLPTGDRVELGRTPTGAFTLTMLGRLSGGGAASLRSGTAAYVIPRSVLPVLGSTLDLSLFDAAGIAARGGRTPVTVTYADPSSPTAVPGVEITSRDGIRATGVITAASSRALGVALRTQDAARLFAGVTSVRGTSTPARTTSDNATSDNATSDNARSDNARTGNPTSHRWPMHTVTLRGSRPRRQASGPCSSATSRRAAAPVPGRGVHQLQGHRQGRVPAGIYTALRVRFQGRRHRGVCRHHPRVRRGRPPDGDRRHPHRDDEVDLDLPMDRRRRFESGSNHVQPRRRGRLQLGDGPDRAGTTPIYLSPTGALSTACSPWLGTTSAST